MNILKKIRASLRLTEAIRQADKAHAETGGRYYVMPVSGKNGQLIVMDRANFRKLKHKRYISPDAKVADLERECFYCTPYRNGNGKMPGNIAGMRRKVYYEWLDNTSKRYGKVR